MAHVCDECTQTVANSVVVLIRLVFARIEKLLSNAYAGRATVRQTLVAKGLFWEEINGTS